MHRYRFPAVKYDDRQARCGTRAVLARSSLHAAVVGCLLLFSHMPGRVHGQRLKGFGVSPTESRLPGFGKRGAWEKRFTSDVLNTARRWMRDYDKDGSGALERIETKGWSAKDHQRFDLNSDGKMTMEELLKAIAAQRAVAQRANRAKARKSQLAADAKEASRLQQLLAPLPKFDPTASYRQGLCASLAADLIRQYDRNRNKQLDLSEWKAANRRFGRFMGGADSNADNRITSAELTSWLLRRLPPQETARLAAPFRLVDVNGDGQISFQEFSIKHGPGKLAEFRKWDSNNDGLITPRESYTAPVPPGTLAFTRRQARLITSGGTVVSQIWINQDVLIKDIDVRISLTKLNDNFMRMVLIGPDGQRITLFAGRWLPWSNRFTFEGTLIDDEAPLITRTLPRAPFPPKIRTDGLKKGGKGLKHFYGKSARGRWQLVATNLNNRAGVFHQWSLWVTPK